MRTSRQRLFASMLTAAVFAAIPVGAQTNDPNLTDADLECLRRQAKGGPECVIGAEPQAAGGDAVVLPELIADLFPDPLGGRPQGGEPGSLPDNPPVPTPDPRNVPPAATDLASLPLSAPPRAVVGDFVPDEVLVTIEGDGAVAAAIAAEFGLDIRSQRVSPLLGATLVRFGIPDGRRVGVVLAQLAADGRTRSREPNHLYSLQQAAGIVNYAFGSISLDSGAASGEDISVAVIDTAIDETHPALEGVVAGLFDAMPDVPVEARDHATSVAGLIAGVGELRGIAPGSAIYHARAFEGGRSNTDIIIAALDWAASQDVRIINMSFVGPDNDLLEAACANARALDIVMVAAAGNNGPGAPYGYPAAYDGIIAVTATDDKNQLMPQSNRGPYVFVSAPGVNVIAPVGGGSDLVTGTSFAAAVVSGAVANLLHKSPERSADWVEAALSATARDLGVEGRDADFGFGLINAAEADAIR